MAFVGDSRRNPAAIKPPESSSSGPAGTRWCVDPRTPLMNLSAVQARMDSLQKFLSDSVNSNTLLGQQQMDTVASEISSAIQEIIVNGAALLSSNYSISPSQPNLNPELGQRKVDSSPKIPISVDDLEDCEIIEMDAVELLAENVHFCEICGKGFKRDANLRMHMRAHGNQFKTPEALGKPRKNEDSNSGRIRFSCPFVGCNRNKQHKKFRPLKTAVCVKNHFKRSHCPKTHSCTRCNKKSFSVIADLKSHLKLCGESKWRCSCGTSFSRKDKLFGHMALFEGHMPAVGEEPEKGKAAAATAHDNDYFDDGLFDGLDPIEDYCFQHLINSPDT